MRYCALFLLLGMAATAIAESGTQTNWEDGPGVQGPVTNWQSSFYVAGDMDWDTEPGQLKLIVNRGENSIATTNGPYYVVGVDMDIDGDMDVASCGYNSDQVFWVENTNGSGTAWSKHVIGSVNEPQFITVADFDNNGYKDIAASSGAENRIVLFRYFPGGWSSSTTIASGFDARQIRAEDMDGDGYADIVGVSSYSGDVCWWKNDGTSTSWNQSYIDGALIGAHTCDVGDFNGDGHPDVVAASSSANDIVAYISNSPYGYSWTKMTIESNYNSPVSLATADFNSDGSDDFAVASNNGSGNLRWYDYLDTQASWVSHQMQGAGGQNIYDITAADMDGDGYADVTAASYGENKIIWCKNREYLGEAWDTFSVSGYFQGALGVSVADMDSDGVPDVLGCAFSGDELSWWRVSGFTTPSTLTSSILDTQVSNPGSNEWDYIHWSEITPAQTSVMFRVKTSYDSGNMGTWSAWITDPSSLSSIVSQGGRYVQYQVRLATDNPNITPSLKDVSILWDPYAIEDGSVAPVDGRLVWLNSANPVSGAFSVSYNVMQAGRVNISVYDSAGRVVENIASGDMEAGVYSAMVNGLPAGSYAVVMQTSDTTAAQRVVVVR